MKKPASQKDAESDSSETSLQNFVWAGISIVVVALLIALSLYVVALDELPWRESSAAWGQFGDFFGGLFNPMIAFFALIGLAASLSVQQETLRQTRSGLAAQIALQQQQVSQQTFFDLLNLRNQAVESVEWVDAGFPKRGRAALKAILKKIESKAESLSPESVQEELDKWRVPKEVPGNSKPYIALFAALYAGKAISFSAAWIEAGLEQNKDSENSQLLRLEAELGHVFRATYQVLKFTYYCREFDAAQKIDFANYLRAQMSEAEFVLFALTALTKIGEKSHAVAVSFDLYEDRLFSTPWATDLAILFDPKIAANVEFARAKGFEPIQALA